MGFYKLLKTVSFGGLFDSAAGRRAHGYTVLGPLLPHTRSSSFAQSFSVSAGWKSFASVEGLYPIFVLSWLFGLILAEWKYYSQLAFTEPHSSMLSSDPVLKGFGGLLIGMW